MFSDNNQVFMSQFDVYFYFKKTGLEATLDLNGKKHILRGCEFKVSNLR